MPKDHSHARDYTLLEEWLQSADSFVLEPGQILEGVVMHVTPNEVLVDIGTKTEGLVPRKDLERLSEETRAQIVEGAHVRVYVVRFDEDDDQALLSIYRALQSEDWDFIERCVANNEIMEATVTTYNRGGVLAYIGQVRGFVPASHLTATQGKSSQERARVLRQLVGQTIHVKVLDADRRRGRLILSQREAEKQLQQQRKQEMLARLQEGQVVRGTVTNLTDFGAFVDLGGVDGLVHISELSWNRISHPSDVVNVGDEVEVYVLRVDHERQRVGLSLKRLQPEPWSQIGEKYQVGDEVNVIITKLTSFGAFARLEGEEVEGLIHISEMAHRHVAKPSEVVAEGDRVRARIIRLNPERKRIGLSLKAVARPTPPQEQDDVSPPPPAEAAGHVDSLPSRAESCPNGEPTAHTGDMDANTAVEFANIGTDDSN